MPAMETSSPPLPTSQLFDLVIIGSGPAALAVIARILESHPAALYTDDEHAHLHWLKRDSNSRSTSSRSFLKTKWRGTEKVVVGATRSTSQSTPEGYCECGDAGMRILIIDKLGAWMANWNRLFHAYNIEHLRSPMFFHPSPVDVDGLVAYAQRKGRTKVQLAAPAGREKALQGVEADLIEVTGCVGKEVSKHRQKRNKKLPVSRTLPRTVAVNERERKDYFTPSLKLFNDFVLEDIVERYDLKTDTEVWPSIENAVEAPARRITFAKGFVTDLKYTTVHVKGWEPMQTFCIKTQCEDKVTTIAAKAVVCAVGNTAQPNVPSFLQPFANDRSHWCHSLDLATKQLPPPSSHSTLVIIGGGLTSAQISHLAIAKGGYGHVHLFLRGHMKIKPFDVGLEWIGRFANLQKMCFWQEDDPEKRLAVLKEARNGGSITPRYVKILRELERAGNLTIHTCTEVSDANLDDHGWSLNMSTSTKEKIESKIVYADFIVSATGAAPSFSSLPFVSGITTDQRVPDYGGFPFIDENLQYGKIPLFFTGALSALQIGPGAFNLEGMRAAADRIAVRLEEMALGRNAGEEQLDAVVYNSEHAKSASAGSFTHFGFEALPSEVQA